LVSVTEVSATAIVGGITSISLVSVSSLEQDERKAQNDTTNKNAISIFFTLIELKMNIWDRLVAIPKY